MDRGASAPNCWAAEVNLPTEIIIEILSRLPVKSLIRFRLVSKSWYSLIIDPSFIKKHLSQATEYNNLNLRRAILCASPSGIISCPLSILSKSSIKQAEKLYPLTSRLVSQIVFLGDCNGLICILKRGELFLWNPSINQCKKLARPTIPIPITSNKRSSEYAVFGFAYDSFNDDYNVVRIVRFPRRMETTLYSLKTDSWKLIQDSLPSNLCLRTIGKFVNGAFHWLVVDGQDAGASYVIVSLDLSDEKHGTVPLPDDLVMPNSQDQKFDLAVLRGMMCLYCNYFQRDFVIWGMKDYGVQKSWSQMFKFSYDSDPILFSPSRSYVNLVPKYLFENGELLLEAKNVIDRAAILRYRENRLVTMVCGGGVDFGEVHVYVESLICPNAINGA